MMLVVVVACVAVALWWLARANELFCVSVRDGRALVVRGRVPGGLLHELRDMVARPRVARATVRAVKRADGAELVFSGGLDEGRQQRLRNVFAMYPLSRLRAATATDEPRTIGQLLGIAWLAWLFERGRHL